MNKSIHQVIYPPHFGNRAPMKFLTPKHLLTAEVMRRIMQARDDTIAQRKAEGCCEECGHPILDEAWGCDNERECFIGQLAAKRREKALGAS